MRVLKRDGQLVEFDKNKIINAISRAFLEVDGQIYENDTANDIADDIYKDCEEKEQISVEEIQDLVERYLMRSSRPDVAKSYILYREARAKERVRRGKIVSAVMRRIKASDVENANANVDEKSFSGREKEASSDIQKIIALDYTLSKEVSDAHKNMLLYQHDMEKTTLGVHNCLNIDFKKLFENGFSTRNGDIRPPSSFSSACQQTAVIFQCQSQVQFGGAGSVHLDYDLAPYVKKSFRKHMKNYFTDVEDYSAERAEALLRKYEPIEVDNKELKGQFGLPEAYSYAIKQLEREGNQSGEALYHNLNSLESRAGSQVPFTSVNFGRDTSYEGRFVSRKMLESSLAGIGKHHRTPIFPISIFQYKQGCNANPEDPNYDLKQLAIKSLSKRIYPNFVNCDWSQAHEDPSDIDTIFGTMGKRKLSPFKIF